MVQTQPDNKRHFPATSPRLREFLPLREPTAERLAVAQQLARKYGDFIHIQILGKHYYLLNRPADIRNVIIEQADQFRTIPIGGKATARTLNPQQVSADNAFHRKQRRLLQPAFTPAGVAKYAPIMSGFTNDLLDRWQPGDVRNIADDLTALTLRIVAQALFSADVSDQHDTFSEAVRLGSAYIAGGNRTPFWIPTRTNRHLVRAYLGMDRAIRQIITTRRKQPADHGDLLSTILYATEEDGGGQLTDKQAHDVILGLFIAGHETTANALLWTWVLLAQNPTVLAVLQAEIRQVLGTRPPTVADLDRLPYTGQVIREALRLYPPAWVITRTAVTDTEVAGYTVPKASLMLMSPYLTQHDGRYFDDPERFRPERWTAAYEKSVPPFAYFPFGGGAHVCLGQFFALLEARLVLATMAQRVSLKLIADQPIPLLPLITLRPAEPVMMRVER